MTQLLPEVTRVANHLPQSVVRLALAQTLDDSSAWWQVFNIRRDGAVVDVELGPRPDRVSCYELEWLGLSIALYLVLILSSQADT